MQTFLMPISINSPLSLFSLLFSLLSSLFSLLSSLFSLLSLFSLSSLLFLHFISYSVLAKPNEREKKGETEQRVCIYIYIYVFDVKHSDTNHISTPRVFHIIQLLSEEKDKPKMISDVQRYDGNPYAASADVSLESLNEEQIKDFTSSLVLLTSHLSDNPLLIEQELKVCMMDL